VQQNVCGDNTTVTINGERRHIVGYLQDFLFSPERARTPVGVLSGGERNRLMLAKMLKRPANVIVLDEPTNDLDAETLELLEDRLVNFAGTVLLVSHDRAFLNNVVTSTIVFEEQGVREYVGGYDDWIRQRKPMASPRASEGSPARTSGKAMAEQRAEAKRKLTFKERKELEGLPGKIERCDAEIAALHHRMADPEFYQQAGGKIAAEQTRLQQLEEELTAAYQRWEELESLS
jgi:ATP-binding cassette subfamily F protein uup